MAPQATAPYPFGQQAPGVGLGIPLVGFDPNTFFPEVTVGGGNIHYGDRLRVPLTTVAWSTLEMGRAAAQILIEMVEGKKKRKEQHIIVEPELVVRESCGAAKAAFA